LFFEGYARKLVVEKRFFGCDYSFSIPIIVLYNDHTNAIINRKYCISTDQNS